MAPPRKRLKTSAVAEVTFDPAAREEYLTGFHKRKQARIKHAQEQAAKREREERIRDRKELREQRKQELADHVAAMNAAMKQANGDQSDAEGSSEEEDQESADKEEWGGFDEPITVNHEDEYFDDDKYTTVTVEAVDISRDGFVSHEAEDDSQEAATAVDKNKEAETEKDDASGNKKRVWTKEKPAREGPKKKKKKFRYESKSERKMTRAKERSKNRSHAKARRNE